MQRSMLGAHETFSQAAALVMKYEQVVYIPGVDSCATSGTTISVPVKSHLSPAWACSTASARKIISTLNSKKQNKTKKTVSESMSQ